LRLAKCSHRGKKLFFLHMPGFPLHKVALDLVGVLVRNGISLPGGNKVRKCQPILRFKTAEGFVAAV